MNDSCFILHLKSACNFLSNLFPIDDNQHLNDLLNYLFTNV